MLFIQRIVHTQRVKQLRLLFLPVFCPSTNMKANKKQLDIRHILIFAKILLHFLQPLLLLWLLSDSFRITLNAIVILIWIITGLYQFSDAMATTTRNLCNTVQHFITFECMIERDFRNLPRKLIYSFERNVR